MEGNTDPTRTPDTDPGAKMAENTKLSKAIQFLIDLGRGDLAALLRFSDFRFFQEEIWDDIFITRLEVKSPAVFTTALEGLPEWDRKRIKEAIVETAEESAAFEHMLFATDKSAAVDDADKLLPEVLIQRDLMIEVATGETRIQDVDDYYRARHRRI